VLAEEREKSLSVVAERARREAARAEAEGRAAREHSVEAVAQEAAVLTAARKNVLAVFGLSARLVPAMDALVGVVRHATLGPDGKPRPAHEIDLTPEQALGLLKSHAGILSRAMAVGQQVIELGRAERGQASAIVGVAVADLTPEQAAELIEEQEAAVELIRGAGRRGAIRDRPRMLGGPGGPSKVEILEHREALEAFGAGAPAEPLEDVEGDAAAVPRFVSDARAETSGGAFAANGAGGGGS
jgi:hypothetical protein